MDVWQRELQDLLKQHGAEQVPSRKHIKYKFPDGRVFVQPASGSDVKGVRNALSDLRRMLGLVESHNRSTQEVDKRAIKAEQQREYEHERKNIPRPQQVVPQEPEIIREHDLPRLPASVPTLASTKAYGFNPTSARRFRKSYTHFQHGEAVTVPQEVIAQANRIASYGGMEQANKFLADYRQNRAAQDTLRREIQTLISSGGNEQMNLTTIDGYIAEINAKISALTRTREAAESFRMTFKQTAPIMSWTPEPGGSTTTKRAYNGAKRGRKPRTILPEGKSIVDAAAEGIRKFGRPLNRQEIADYINDTYRDAGVTVGIDQIGNALSVHMTSSKVTDKKINRAGYGQYWLVGETVPQQAAMTH